MRNRSCHTRRTDMWGLSRESSLRAIQAHAIPHLEVLHGPKHLLKALAHPERMDSAPIRDEPTYCRDSTNRAMSAPVKALDGSPPFSRPDTYRLFHGVEGVRGHLCRGDRRKRT